MRTTIDLPEDLHRIAMSLSRDKNFTLSQSVAFLIRRALDTRTIGTVKMVDGLPTIEIGRPISSDDVRSLEDDE